ncbi:MAG: DUF2191 domain-containing protein [Chloroflexota bacterium]|nr:DUF2191 domain-containing protein [Chloroflexota bacterium]
MKTTIDIATPLLESAKRKAREEHRSLKDLVEEGLRRILADEPPELPFKLKHHPFAGHGLQPGIREGDWETVRDVIYGLK